MINFTFKHPYAYSPEKNLKFVVVLTIDPLVEYDSLWLLSESREHFRQFCCLEKRTRAY